MGEGELAARESEKTFQAAQQPAEAADDFVVAPICVGCDFLEQSSRAWEPRCQDGGLGSGGRAKVQAQRGGAEADRKSECGGSM